MSTDLSSPASCIGLAQLQLLLHEAGNPYYDAAFGGWAETQKVIAQWIVRSNSEIAFERVEIVADGAGPVGCFVAMGGLALMRCRRVDMLALFKDARGAERAALLERLADLRSLFAPVDERDFYLSKLAVIPDRRGTGAGATVLEQYLERGRRSGFGRFRLDVSRDNVAAVRLYEHAGFEVVNTATTPKGQITYLGMVREDGADR